MKKVSQFFARIFLGAKSSSCCCIVHSAWSKGWTKLKKKFLRKNFPKYLWQLMANIMSCLLPYAKNMHFMFFMVTVGDLKDALQSAAAGGNGTNLLKTSWYLYELLRYSFFYLSFHLKIRNIVIPKTKLRGNIVILKAMKTYSAMEPCEQI